MATAPDTIIDVLPLLGRAKLLSEARSRDGVRVPAGATGTIVEVLGGGDAYIVEFLHPAHAVLTLRADALGRLN